MASKNSKAATAVLEAYNARDYDGIAKRFTDDGVFVDTAQGASYKGSKEIHDVFALWGEAFTDSRLTQIEPLDAEDTVVVRFTFNGTQDHPFGSLAATKRRATIPACMIFAFDKKGKIVEDTVYYDALSMMAQLGHVKPPM